MPRRKATGGKPPKRPIDRYEHTDKKRINNPPVGLVTSATDPPLPTHKAYEYVQPVPTVKPGTDLDYDPHLDPQLVWAGKKEHTSLEIPTVSLHVHERIDPRTIIDAVRRRNGNGSPVQPSLFERREENPPLREAIDFYRHAHGWSNRLIAGDSLLVMNSLLEKEGMAGQVQMVYIDPPYGIKYGSNFQPFVNKRDVRDGKDNDLTQEPEMVKAFRDTWELGVHSYLTYLRDRLLLAKELLHPSGSCFVQIGDEHVHHVREMMDEVFETKNRVSLIPFKKTSALGSKGLDTVNDYLLWYAKNSEQIKYRQLYSELEDPAYAFRWIQLEDGTCRRLTSAEVNGAAKSGRLFRTADLTSQSGGETTGYAYDFAGRTFHPSEGAFWKTSASGMRVLHSAQRLMAVGNTLTYKRYADDFPVSRLTNWWEDTVQSTFAVEKIFVVQTYTKVISRCLLMTTDPGDLVLDPTCGSGTTAYVGEQWGRRWITCDTSRVAVTLAKQRLMAADFDYYELAHPQEGVGSGFRYKTVPHITLKSIANNPEIREGMTREQIDAAIARYAEQETLYDQPYVDRSRLRVTGPFTVEAVPAPTVKSLEEIEAPPLPADASITRSGPTLRHAEWRDELLKTGLRGKGGHRKQKESNPSA